ncbi:DICT sensory domain-containing protein [Halorubrum gandharaense]
MSLIELIAGVEAHEATLTVFNPRSGDAASLSDHFADRNVSVEATTTDADPERFAVLSRDGEFVTAVDVAELLAPRERTTPAFATEPYRPVLDHLDETLFTSYTTRDMVAASREIEDRAWRMGHGELHAGFQTLSVLGGEAETYNRLGEAPALDVHAYAAPEGELPDAESVTVHVERAPEIRETWFVAYDGDGVDEAKCALLAEEREPGRFYGFWSYDPSTVDYMIRHLTETYGPAETPDEGGATV